MLKLVQKQYSFNNVSLFIYIYKSTILFIILFPFNAISYRPILYITAPKKIEQLKTWKI